jgi:prepilin-type N-terminal cleavage/methylation domain-containing protein
MTISPRPAKPVGNPCHGRAYRPGFTLIELLVAASLSAILLTAVLSSFLFLARSGISLVHYNEMEAEARRGLQVFAEDVRSARDITWNDADRGAGGHSITLTLPGLTSNADEVLVTYYYDASQAGPTARSFCRKSGGRDSAAPPVVLVSHVTRFGLERYKAGIDAHRPASDKLAVNDLETKQLQLTLTASRERATVATSTHIVLSARFILRNKPFSRATLES